jgi:hypothetical protein
MAPAVVQNPGGAPFQGIEKQLLDEIQRLRKGPLGWPRGGPWGAVSVIALPS